MIFLVRTNPGPCLPALLLGVLSCSLFQASSRAGQVEPVTPALEAVGRIRCAYWRELPGNTVKELTASPLFPKFPAEQVYLDRLEIPADQEQHFGTQVNGYLHPPVDGNYTFWIAGDNQCELWLSPDEDPVHKARIAEVPEWSMQNKWDQDPRQKSAPIPLKAGRRYYIEALQKDGGGDNSLAVAWTLPDGTLEEPIPGSRLSPIPFLEIPPPRVRFDPATPLPSKPGAYRLKAKLEYRGQELALPLLLTLPEQFRKGQAAPLLLYLHDAGQAPDAEGFRVLGPDQTWQANPWFRRWYPFIGVSPQAPADRDWGTRLVLQAAVALVDSLLEHYALDRRRIYATGFGAGASAVWRLALERPGLFAALAPVCGGEVEHPELVSRLQGTAVFLISGKKYGFAAGCAVKMQARLAGNEPKPVLYYEDDVSMELADKVYGETWLYGWLAGQQRRPAASPARARRSGTPAGESAWVPIALGLGAALFLLALGILLRSARDKPEAGTELKEEDEGGEGEDAASPPPSSALTPPEADPLERSEDPAPSPANTAEGTGG